MGGETTNGSEAFPTFDASDRANSNRISLRKGAPPPLQYSQSYMTPKLRQSSSFSRDNTANSSPGSRRSDPDPIQKRGSGDSVEKKPVNTQRKKSTISNTMSSVLDAFKISSPRRMQISAPENPVHLTHVGYDNETGQFTVRVTFL